MGIAGLDAVIPTLHRGLQLLNPTLMIYDKKIVSFDLISVAN